MHSFLAANLFSVWDETFAPLPLLARATLKYESFTAGFLLINSACMSPGLAHLLAQAYVASS